ncbi:hypothetical protein [Xanthomonas arboricola]|uniref:hypothetical protein n=1 Tax=Xanthomonas arboricola TaxID=56448 RepID=UPI000E1F1879|nr:hypothetical protein [Xanthomonas arboricola]
MQKVKVHEEFYSIDSTDEWKDRTTVSVYFYEPETSQLTVGQTRSFRDYRSNTESSDPTTAEVVELEKAPKIVREKLADLGY